jgi:hypothetical protein
MNYPRIAGRGKVVFAAFQDGFSRQSLPVPRRSAGIAAAALVVALNRRMGVTNRNS